MSRDYKHAKRRSTGSGMSGIAGFVAGLALGLSVALAVYLYDRRPAARVAQSAAPMTTEEDLDQGKRPAPGAEDPDQEFEFYEMLPKFEVVVPEKEGASRAVRSDAPIEKPGAYILQAGSFRNSADADRARALIAMQGVESKIVPYTTDKDTWHRVRIGPITNLQQLEETRSKLRQVKIEPLVIPIGQ